MFRLTIKVLKVWLFCGKIVAYKVKQNWPHWLPLIYWRCPTLLQRCVIGKVSYIGKAIAQWQTKPKAKFCYINEVHMRTTAKFEKVSLETFLQSGSELTYNNINLPKRATSKSAGYDFFAPTDIMLEPGQTVTVATGVRALMPDNWCLMIFPRSGLGFKFRLRLDNTVGIIDADYCNAPNEGHIFVKITNEGEKSLCVPAGNAFAQGIFTQYFLTEDDDVTTERTGGLGSTDKK